MKQILIGTFPMDEFGREEVEQLNNTSITDHTRLMLLKKGVVFFHPHNFMTTINDEQFDDQSNWVAFITDIVKE